MALPASEEAFGTSSDGVALPVLAAVVAAVWVDEPELLSPPAVLEDAVVGVEDPTAVVVVVVVVEPVDPGAASNVPLRCHWPVKLLNGPPTIWLVQLSVNAPVEESYVPVGPAVSPGKDPPGLGEP